MSGREQMLARIGNVQRLRTRGEKMHTISRWQRKRQFSVPFAASVRDIVHGRSCRKNTRLRWIITVNNN